MQHRGGDGGEEEAVLEEEGEHGEGGEGGGPGEEGGEEGGEGVGEQEQGHSEQKNRLLVHLMIDE